MRETTYKCDVCKEKGNKDNLTPFHIDYNGVMQFLLEIDSGIQHMCNNCIDMIYAYKRDDIEKEQIITKKGA